MQKSMLLLAVAFLFSGTVHLSGQETFKDDAEKFKVKFYSNKSYKEAFEAKDLSPNEKIDLFKTAAEELAKEGKWEGYVFARGNMIFHHKNTKDTTATLKILEETIKRVKKEAPDFYPKCSGLYHQTAYVFDEANDLSNSIFYAKKGRELFNLSTFKYGRLNEFGSVYMRIGVRHAMKGDLEGAKYYFHLSEELISKVMATGRCIDCIEALGASYGNLGKLYSELGIQERSLEYSEKAVELIAQTEGANNPILGYDYFNIGISYRVLSEFEESRTYFKKAISIIENSDTEHAWLKYAVLPSSYHALGESFHANDQPEKSIPYQKKSLKIVENQEDTEYTRGQALLELASAYNNLDSFQKAKEYFSKVESLILEWEEISAVLQDVSVSTPLKELKFRYEESLGRFESHQGQYEQALVHFKKSLDYSPGKGLYELLIHSKISDEYVQLDLLDSAYLYNRYALEIAFPNSEFGAFELPNPEDAQPFTDIYDILKKEADLLSQKATGNDGNLKDRYMDSALAAVDLADQVHTKNLKRMNILRANKSKALIRSSIAPFEKGVFLSEKKFTETKDRKYLEKGFYYTQKMKAQQLWLTDLNDKATAYIDQELLKRETHLLSDITAYENAVFEAKKEKDSVKIQRYESELLFNARKEYAALQRQLEKDYPQYFQAKYAFVPETESSLQQILAPNELVIEYALTDSALFIFTLSQNEPLTFQKTPINRELYEQIIAYSEMLQNSSVMRKSTRERFIKLSNELYRIFLQPVEKQTAGKQRLIIVGDGMTNYIPFESLLKSPELKSFNALDFLIKDFEISYHYSSTLFAKAKRKKFETNTGIYAFAPVYDSDISGTLSGNFRSDSTLRALAADGSFAPLPESEREVNSIFNLFNKNGDKNSNTLDLRAEANEASLKENLEKPYQFVHIAGHSFADVKNPKFSGIACHENLLTDSIETAMGNDGTLYTGEIYNIRSSADLVTLSSCESGLGKLEKTEGLLGLNRAFIYAGTPNVIFSLWKVYDKVSAKLMVDFYKRILDGESYSTSLRMAKLKILKDEKTAAPHFWSPFLLIGR